MCTAVSLTHGKHYFGRNLDLEGSFGEGVVVVPRNMPLRFVREGTLNRHYAMIGIAIVHEGFPLCFDAVNEYGLGMAGLNFPKNATYLSDMGGMKNVAPFEIIPYVLSRCKTAQEARELLANVNLVQAACGGLPLTPLHWMIADGDLSLVAEPMADGLKVYEDPVKVLTNNPPFPVQLHKLSDYLSLTPYEPEPRFGEGIGMENYSRGMGPIGLPGDWSSSSRFVRAAFVRHTAVIRDPVADFFSILRSVAVPRGCMRLKEGVYEETLYSSCSDGATYWYATASDPDIRSVSMNETDLEGTMPAFYPLERA